MSGNKFCIEYAKRGTAGCKKCKTKIDKQVLRIAKIVSNPFSESGGDMKNWFHIDCIFDQFSRARATTKVIEDPSDLDGWENVNDDDKKMVLEKMKALGQRSPAKKTPQAKKSNSAKSTNDAAVDSGNDVVIVSSPKPATSSDPNHKDNSFREFRRLCAKLADEPSYNQKTLIVKHFLTKGSDGTTFNGDLYIWVKMLIPGVIKRVYNLQSKQLVKLFSQIFATNVDSMITDLEQGDVAETVRVFFESSKHCTPFKKSCLNLFDVDSFLEELSQISREDDQQRLLKSMCERCTSNDLKMVVRLIKHDLRINAGAKHILDAIHDDAYQVFQASRNLNDVIEKVLKQCESGLKKSLSISINLMTPVLPMLAEACKSVEYAMKKCPNGMYAEVKYDGERVQVHKQGTTFLYFSRSLKPVLPHKVQHFKDFIPKAFPHGQDIILDSEVLLIDNKTGKPLPFGTLNKHKKTSFSDANVCLFIFDCLMYNGMSLMEMPIIERRKFLYKNMTEIPNRIMFSNATEVQKPADLKGLIMQAIDEGLEGLVLKDLQSVYEPGKRHWLKVKKDYLAEGAMADTADLVVLGAYFGTGNKGGMKSIFLMGCLNEKTGRWCTVTKVHGGHDDKTLEKLQTQLDMIKISKDTSKLPSWLNINTSNKSLVPDFIARDPKTSQVWEITGAEFSKADIHTANGISIRFPRVTRIRRDKAWNTATTLAELETLFNESKKSSDVPGLLLGSLNKVANTPSKDQPEYDEDKDVDEPTEQSQRKIDESTSGAGVLKGSPPKKSRKSRSEKDGATKGGKYRKDSYNKSSDHHNSSDVQSNESLLLGSPNKVANTPSKDQPEYDEDTDVDEPTEQSPRKKNKIDESTSGAAVSNGSPPKKLRKSHSEKDGATKGGKYGKDSYNKSSDHHSKYHHNSSDVKSNESIPDVFTDLKLFILSSLPKFELLKRYVIAFNGTVVDDVHINQATHVIGELHAAETNGSCEHVSDQWLWDCIKLKKLLKTDAYKVV